MELTNDFVVTVPADEAWALLTDLVRIAPCMPGAELQEIEGDEYRGLIKVKVGPITAHYQGRAFFVERDEASRRAVLRAEGREVRGQGAANATITATLSPESAGTRVTVLTDLAISGRAAQFGRGVLSDVSAKLLSQFVVSLERSILSRETDSSTIDRSTTVAPAVPPEAVDLLSAAGLPVLKRVSPIIVGLLLGAWVLYRLLRPTPRDAI